MLERLSTRIIAAILLCVAVVGLVLAVLHFWQSSRSAGAQSRVDKAQGEAAASTGHEATGTVANTAAAADSDRKTSQEAQDAINRAEAGNSNDAADAAVCSLRAYRDTERCRQLRALHP